MTRERLIQLGWAVAALALMAFLAGGGLKLFVAEMMRNAITVDYPWLLEAGRHMIDSGALPETDIFSWTHDQEPWVLYQWLFELGLAAGEGAFGLDALVRIFLLTVVAIYLLIPLLGGVPRRVPFTLTVAAGSLALIIITLNMSIRPGLLTTLFLLVQYLTLAAMRRGRLGLYGGGAVIAVVYLLWGNIHMGVILGLISLLLMLAGDALEKYEIRRFEPADAEVEGKPLAAMPYLVLFGVAFLASLLNPYGFHIYERIFSISTQAGHTANVDELQGMNFQWLQGQILLLFLGGFMLALTRSRQALSSQEILHLIVFTVMGLFAARLVLWTALFYALILPKALHHVWVDASQRHRFLQPVLGAAEEFRRLVVPMLFVFAIGITVVAPQAVRPLELGLCEEMMPGLEAANQHRRPGDKLFNDPRTGSCLLLVDPTAKLFIDPRFEFFGQEFLSESASAMRLETDWRATFDKWDVDTALVFRQWPLAGALASDSAYETVYEDELFVMVRRKASE